MAQIRVNPTRMELLRLKKRSLLARKGHKLLKEKRDGLMQEFLSIVRQAQTLRKEVDIGLAEALRHFMLAQAAMDPQAVRMLSYIQTQKAKLTVAERNVMGVKIPDFNISLEETGEMFEAWETSAELPIGLEQLHKVLPKLLELAAIEKSAELLAQEIERTRRRVNALEHVLIPQLEQTIRYITMKLDELERAQIIMTIAVKNAIT